MKWASRPFNQYFYSVNDFYEIYKPKCVLLYFLITKDTSILNISL